MALLNADTMANSAGTGAPNFPFGLDLSTGQTLLADKITDVAGTGGPTFTKGFTGVIYAAYINNTGSVASIIAQFGGAVASVSRVSTGIVTVTINSGIFTVNPFVVITPDDSGGAYEALLDASSLSTTNVEVRTYANTILTDNPFMILLVGI